jgi:cytochrome P450
MDGWVGGVQKMMAARMANPRDAFHDFFAMTNADLTGGQPRLLTKELWAEAIFFVGAGASTMSTTMSGIFFYLSQNPEACARLASEVRTTFPTGKDIRRGNLLSSCKYLRAVIEETLRMSGPALTPPWREQSASLVAKGESLIVDGHVIPPGTQVGVSPYYLHHDPETFPEPYSFRPERWLPFDEGAVESAEDRERRARMKLSFTPWG